jgi:hypothetical protein
VIISSKFDEDFKPNRYNEIKGTTPLLQHFFHGGWYFLKKLAAKVGLRASYNDLLEESAISPRISMAYKVSKTVSFRGLWNFTQSHVDYIKYSKLHQFESESFPLYS